MGNQMSQENESDEPKPQEHVVLDTPKSKKDFVDFGDPRSPSATIPRTPILLDAPCLDDTFYESKLVQQLDDPRSPSMDIVRTPIAVPASAQDVPLHKQFANLKLHNKLLDRAREPIVFNTPLKIRKDKSPSTPSKLRVTPVLETNLDTPTYTETDLDNVEPIQLETVNKLPNIDLNADINNFGEKLTKLIYEDTHIAHTPPIQKVRNEKKIRNSRTPLGSISNNKLRVSDRPTRKIELGGSKIPVLKGHRKRHSCNDIQCENTPPPLVRMDTARRSRWDTDDTLVI